MSRLSPARVGRAMPAARVFHNANQAIANATVTNLAFNSERYDTDAMHDTVTNNSRITIRTPGLYRFTSTITWDSALVATRVLNTILLNNSSGIGRMETNKVTGTSLTQCCTCTWPCVAGDFVEVQVFQDGGGSTNVAVLSPISPEFSAERIG